MIPALLGLRHAIDRALDALAPLEDVLAVWGARTCPDEGQEALPYHPRRPSAS